MTPSSSSVDAALRDFGFRNAGTPLLMASTPVSAAQPDENALATRKTIAKPITSPCSDCIWKSADSARSGTPRTWIWNQPPAQHDVHADHEGVGGNRERRARLPDAAQVQRREHQDGGDREQHLVLSDERHRRPDVRHRRRHRHRDGEHVVDHQRARHRQPGGAAQIRGDHLVVTAAGRIGVHVLPVARDHDEHHRRHGQPDPRRHRVGAQPGHREHQEDFLRRVRDRGQCVGGEDGQRYPLGQQRVPHGVAAERTSEDQPARSGRELGHESQGYA